MVDETNSYVALDDRHADVCGRLVFWSVSKTACPYQTIVDRLSKEFNDPKFPMPVISRCRAIQDAISRNFLSSSQNVKVTESYGIVRVYSPTGESEMEGENEKRKFRLVLEVDFRNDPIHYRGPLSEQARTLIESALETFTGEQLALWLPKVMLDYLDGVRMRERGGFYFVPKTKVPTLNRIAKVLSECMPGARIYRIPMLSTSDDAIESVLEVVQRTLESRIQEMVELYQNALGSTTGRKRKKLCRIVQQSDDLIRLAETYEGVLNRSLEDIKRLVQSTKNQAETTLSEIDIAF